MLSIPWYEIDPGIEKLSYGLELCLFMVLATNMTQFSYWKASRDPTVLPYARIIAAGGAFSLGYPLAIYVIYVGHVGYPEWKMWVGNTYWPNTFHGIALLAFRWIGLFSTGYGVAQVLHMPAKIRRKWAELRGTVGAVKRGP